MPKILEETEKQLGTVPGTILYHGAKKTSKVKIQIIDYTGKTFVEKKVKDVKECFAFKKKDTVTWINITGIHDTYLVKQIGELFDIHDLVLEDIVNPNQRPKIEDYEAYLFVVLQMVYGTKKVETEQVSLIISDSFVISFQEKDGDVFDHVRERIRKAKGRIKRKDEEGELHLSKEYVPPRSRRY